MTGLTAVGQIPLAIALGEPPEVFDGSVAEPPTQLRLIHYPYDPGAGEWVDVPLVADAAVVAPLPTGSRALSSYGQRADPT